MTNRGAPRHAHRLLASAQAISAELAGAGFGVTRPAPPPVPTPAGMDLFDAMVTDPDVSATSRTLFRDGHHARAVEEGFKFLNNAVKGKTGEHGLDGPNLMHHAFSETTPVLRLNRMRTVSQKDEQAGYRFIFAGVMTGIRNPRAHDHALRDDPDVALEMLTLANHLMRRLRASTKARRRRTP